MPAMITAVSTVPEVRVSNEWLSSSMAKTTPASGVLNAAATPPRRRPAPRRGAGPGAAGASARPSACMIAAPTCTVGPSRPIEAPQARPSSVSSTLPIADAQRQHRVDRLAVAQCSAAIICGMPLPCAPGKTAAGQPDRQRQPGRRQQQRAPGPAVQQPHQHALRRIGCPREGQRGQRHRDRAAPGDRARGPRRRDSSGATWRSLGGSRMCPLMRAAPGRQRCRRRAGGAAGSRDGGAKSAGRRQAAGGVEHGAIPAQCGASAEIGRPAPPAAAARPRQRAGTSEPWSPQGRDSTRHRKFTHCS